MPKNKKKKNSNYITKADIEAKLENEAWEEYFKTKKATRKFANKNKARQTRYDPENT